MTIGVKIKKIKKVNNLEKKVKVYDIEVEDAHHYIFEDGTVSHNSYVPTKEISGGSGLKYSASTIITLSKKKEKDGTEVIGNIIKAKATKSRLSKENKEVEVRLYYDQRGLDRYYGMPQLAAEAGIWKYNAGRYEIEGKKIFEKEILRNPENYFTQEVMEEINEYVKKTFNYGN